MSWFTIRYGIYPWKKIAGIFLPLRPSMGYSVLRFADAGDYESGEITIVSNTIQPDDIVMELGTGLGFISAWCSQKVGSERVFTYEANPLMENDIRKLYRKNQVSPNVTFSLLGAEAGVKTFYVSKHAFFSSSALPISDAKAIEVKMLKLNDEIARLQPTYFIMDIEGGEYDVFSIIDFQSIRKVQFELHPGVLDKEKVDAIFLTLQLAGFTQNKSFTGRDNYYFYR